MRDQFTRREWLTTTAGAAAGLGVLTGPGVRFGEAQGQPRRGGTLRVATVDKPVNMDPGCDMIKRADLSVIGDSGAILAALIQLATEYRQGGARNAA